MKCKKKNKKKFKMPIFLLGVMIKTMLSIIKLKEQKNKKLVLFTYSLHLLIIYNQ